MTNNRIRQSAQEIVAAKSRKKRGLAAEVFIVHLMDCERYHAKRACPFSGHDLEVIDIHTHEIVRIEVKVSMRNRSGGFKCCLRKDDRHGKTDVRCSDWLIVLCWIDHFNYSVFAVPVAATGTARFLWIPENWNAYSGKYADYRLKGEATWQSVFTANASKELY